MAETMVKLLGLEDDYKPIEGESDDVFAAFIGEMNKNFLSFIRNKRTEDPVHMLALIPKIKREYLYKKLNEEIGLHAQIFQREDKSMDYRFI